MEAKLEADSACLMIRSYENLFVKPLIRPGLFNPAISGGELRHRTKQTQIHAWSKVFLHQVPISGLHHPGDDSV